MNCNDDIGRDPGQRTSAGAHQREPCKEHTPGRFCCRIRGVRAVNTSIEETAHAGTTGPPEKTTRRKNRTHTQTQGQTYARTRTKVHTSCSLLTIVHKQFNERDMLSPFLTITMMMMMVTVTMTRGYRTEMVHCGRAAVGGRNTSQTTMPTEAGHRWLPIVPHWSRSVGTMVS